jgi:hypothetical protein
MTAHNLGLQKVKARSQGALAATQIAVIGPAHCLTSCHSDSFYPCRPEGAKARMTMPPGLLNN